MGDDLWYPSVEDVLAIHETLIGEYPETESGVRDRGAIDFALDYVKDGVFTDVPDTIHGKAVHLLRLLVANHPFVDGNKRTALNTVYAFYYLNGFRVEYGHEIREILGRFASNEADVDAQSVHDYLRGHVVSISLDEAVNEWRDELLSYGLTRLSEERSDPNE